MNPIDVLGTIHRHSKLWEDHDCPNNAAQMIEVYRVIGSLLCQLGQGTVTSDGRIYFREVVLRAAIRDCYGEKKA